MTLGEKFKHIRSVKGLSLEMLARKTNLTRSFLSQIEKNKTSPSISSLLKLADALDINVSDLFRAERVLDEYIIHQNERESFSIEKNKLKVELLAPRAREKKFEPVLVHFGVGGSTELISASGAIFCLLLEGRLELSLGTDTHILSPGDSIYLESPAEHTWKSIGDHDVLAFVVSVTPIGRETIA